jgi:hypothetical protein
VKLICDRLAENVQLGHTCITSHFQDRDLSLHVVGEWCLLSRY